MRTCISPFCGEGAVYLCIERDSVPNKYEDGWAPKSFWEEEEKNTNSVTDN
jgi:hypothetical protein